MIKELKYTGYTAQPSDYESPDGDLSVSLNLIPEDGAIHPVMPPAIELQLGFTRHYLLNTDKPRVSIIHTVAGQQNYIITTSKGYLYWVKKEASDRPQTDENAIPLAANPSFDNIISLCPFGNFLILSTSNGTHYILWNSQNKTYNYLGTKIPDINLSFGLLGDVIAKNYSAKIKLLDTQITKSETSWQPIESLRFTATGKLQWSHIDTTGFKSRIDHYISDPIELKSDIMIEKDNEYMLEIDYSSMKNFWSKRIRLYGYYQAFGKSRLITTTGSNKKSILFTAPDNFTALNLTIEFENFSMATTGSLRDPLPSISVSATITLSHASISRSTDSENIKRIEYSESSYQAISAAVNKFITSEAVAKNKFIYPFFVRYAIRLYDGSHINISPPVLLIPNSSYVPLIFFRSDDPQLSLRAFIADLQYRINTDIDLSIWRDLITGIDIFVSSAAWPYNQGEEYSPEESNFAYTLFSEISNKGFLRLVHTNVEVSGGEYRPLDLIETSERFFDDLKNYQSQVLQIAQVSTEDLLKKLTSTSTFYLYSSIPIEKIVKSSEFVSIEAKEGILSTLQSQRPLSLDIIPYAGFANGLLSAYNNRLNIANASYLLPLPSMLAHTNTHLTDKTCSTTKVIIQLQTNYGDRFVINEFEAEHTSESFKWFFYPDSRATKATFIRSDLTTGETQIAELELKTHEFLNGSYWIADSLDNSVEFEPIDSDNPKLIAYESVINNPAIPASNSIYLSETSNPFLFTNTLTVAVGSGKILGLSTAARALSQGQFGQFPLYAFTSEGVWALEVSSTGSYTARQPITRDVILDNTDPLQMDNAVLFATDRGIMLISGSQTQCITDVINSTTPFDVLLLPGMKKLHSILGHESDTCLPTSSFLNFLSQCGMLYDYVHQQVIVYNPNFTYAYIYSLKSNEWGMTYSSIETSINSYPDALALTSDGKLVNFSKSNGTPLPALLVTRPLKFDAPDVLKTVDTVIQRGNFRKGHVQSVLYGSRDLVNWHLVWSSKDHYLRGFRGTPYKYYRIALLCNLAEGESIFGATVQFTPRQLNQPR